MDNKISDTLPNSVIVAENTDEYIIIEKSNSHYSDRFKDNNNIVQVEISFFQNEDIKHLQLIAEKIYRAKKEQREKEKSKFLHQLRFGLTKLNMRINNFKYDSTEE